jgi:hypothetical protein
MRRETENRKQEPEFENHGVRSEIFANASSRLQAAAMTRLILNSFSVFLPRELRMHADRRFVQSGAGSRICKTNCTVF